MQNLPSNIKGLASKYGVDLDNIYYKTSKKKYSFEKIKKEIFEEKFGKGNNHYDSYFNYFLPRILKSSRLTDLKKEFFTDYKLSEKLSYEKISFMWEKIMQKYLNL